MRAEAEGRAAAEAELRDAKSDLARLQASVNDVMSRYEHDTAQAYEVRCHLPHDGTRC